MAITDEDDHESAITPGSTWSTCKDCGKRYSYSTASMRVERAARMSAPERCRTCAQLHRKEIDSVGVAHFSARGRDGGPVPLGISSGRLGKIHHEPREHIEVPPNPIIDEEIKKAGVTDQNLDDLFTALSTHQVVLVEGGTGSGKSTYVPCRLVEPGTDERRALWVPRGPVVITQPRVQATIAIPQRVAELLGVGVGPRLDVGYRYHGVDESDLTRNRIVFMTDGVLLNWLLDGAKLDAIAAIVIDEAHERTLRIDVILAIMRRVLPRYPHLKLLIASATINTAMFRRFFGDPALEEDDDTSSILDAPVPVIRCAARTAGYELKYRPEGAGARPPLSEYDAAIKTGEGIDGKGKKAISRALVDAVVDLLNETPDETDDILGFLASTVEVNETCQSVRDRIEGDPRMAHVDVHPLHRQLSEKTRAAATERKPDPSRRRVIIATNIAETSLTIEELNYVVDSGLIVQTQWNDADESTDHPSVLHSKAGCRQRWGRVGRVRPGKVRTLYTERQFDQFSPHTAPEVQRSALDDLVMKVKLAGFEPSELTWLEDLDKEMIEAACRRLERADALAPQGHVTAFGAEMSRLAMGPDDARLMIEADRYGCSIEMATWLAIQGSAPFGDYRNLDPVTRARAARAHEALRGGARDDLDVYLKLFSAWKGEFGGDVAHDARSWSEAWFVEHETMVETEQKREDHLKGFSVHGKEDERRAIDFSLIDRTRELISMYSRRDRFVLTGGRYVSPRVGAASLSASSSVTPGTAELVAFELNHLAGGVEVNRAVLCTRERLIPAGGAIGAALAMRAATCDADGALLADTPFAWLRMAIEQIAPPGARYLVAPPDSAGMYALAERLPDEAPFVTARAEWSVDDASGGTPADDGPPVRDNAIFASDEGEIAPPVPVMSSDSGEGEDAGNGAPDQRRHVRLLDRMTDAVRGRLAGTGGSVAAVVDVVEVVGYDREAPGGPVALLRPAQASSFAVATSGLHAGDEITVEIEGVLKDPLRTAWRAGSDVLATRLVHSGIEVLFDPEDVTLDGQAAALSRLPSGARAQATITEVDSERQRVRASLLPSLIRHRESVLPSGSGAFPATVVAVGAKKAPWLDLVIDVLSDPEHGHIITARLKHDDLLQPSRGYRAGDDIMVEVEPRSGATEFPRTTVAYDVQALHPALHLDTGNSRLRFNGQMSPATYRDLRNTTTSRVMREALHRLLRDSNCLKAREADPAIEAALLQRYPAGSDVEVTIRQVAPAGIIVDLPDGGHRRWISRADLDRDPRTPPSVAGAVGDRIQVRATSTGGRLRLSRKALQPNPLNALSEIAGTDRAVEAVVLGIQPGRGLTLVMPGGVTCFLPWHEAPGGNHEASKRFVAGGTTQVRVLSVDTVSGKVLLTGHLDRPIRVIQPAAVTRLPPPPMARPTPQRTPPEALAPFQRLLPDLPLAALVQIHLQSDKFTGLATMVAIDREAPLNVEERRRLAGVFGGDWLDCIQWSDDPGQLLRNALRKERQEERHFVSRDVVVKVDWGFDPQRRMIGFVLVEGGMAGWAVGVAGVREKLTSRMLGVLRLSIEPQLRT